jgi:hypothetical protein
VLHDERWVVLDPPARMNRADQVVGLLARAPWLPGAEPEALVEVADPPDELAPEKDRRGIRAVPQVVGREDRDVPLP